MLSYPLDAITRTAERGVVMQDLSRRVEKVLKEWEEIKSEYALPNSMIAISDIWTNSYDMACIIKELTQCANDLKTGTYTKKVIDDIAEKEITLEGKVSIYKNNFHIIYDAAHGMINRLMERKEREERLVEALKVIISISEKIKYDINMDNIRDEAKAALALVEKE